jgi:hypothetical protein
MVLSVRYPTRESIEIALASEVRLKSREVSKDLIAMFDGTVFHHGDGVCTTFIPKTHTTTRKVRA